MVALIRFKKNLLTNIYTVPLLPLQSGNCNDHGHGNGNGNVDCNDHVHGKCISNGNGHSHGHRPKCAGTKRHRTGRDRHRSTQDSPR